MSSEEQVNTFVNQFESTIHSRLEKWQRYMTIAFEQYQHYNVIMQNMFANLWQHEEFRLGVYIFGILSFIPLVLFIGFMSLVLLFSTVLAAFIWALITFTLLSVSCIILIPVLIALILVTAFMLLAFILYQSLLVRLKQQQKTKYK